jgi:hypothetical protein
VTAEVRSLGLYLRPLMFALYAVRLISARALLERAR